MSDHYPRVRVHASHGALIIRDGLKLSFYMRRSNREIAQEVMRSLETYLQAVGPQTLAEYLDLEGDWQLLDLQSWEATRRNLLESHWARIVLVEPLAGDRAVISLGPWPEAGDTDAGRSLPEYRELTRVLGPHLYRPSGPWSPYFPDDTFQLWAHRFLD